MKKVCISCILLLVFATTASSHMLSNTEQSFETSSDALVLYVGGSGPGNYSHIQDAIDNASEGDSIYVYDDSSPYIENIVINKSISLTGENPDATVIDGNKTGDVVIISAEYVILQFFTITASNEWNDYSGVRVKSDNTVIAQNLIVENKHGILLENTKNSNISNNTFINLLGAAIVMNDSSNNRIYDNLIVTCPDGILLYDSHENEMMRNTFQNCFQAVEFTNSTFNVLDNNVISYMLWAAIFLWKNADHNTISYNSIVNNDDAGIMTQDSAYTTIIGNSIIANNREGICISSNSSNILVHNNDIENNKDIGGIHIGRECTNSIISNNVLKGNRYGIYTSADGLQIIENTFVNSSDIGLRSYYTCNNSILRNNFIGNRQNVMSYSGDNIWDDGVFGNYWDDYNGKDIDGDGIGDIAYTIEDDSHKDSFPLMVPYGSSPGVRINQPRNGFIYIRNLQLISCSSTILFGTIKIDVSAANYVHGIDYVEFYVDNILRKTDATPPYDWVWRISSHLKHRHIIKVIAYDNNGQTAIDEMNALRFF